MTNLASSIDKAVLVGDIHGLRLPQAARPRDGDAPGVHLTTCPLDLGDAVAKIAPQGDVGLAGPLVDGHVAGTVYADLRRQGVPGE